MTWFMLIDTTTGNSLGDYDHELAALAEIHAIRSSGEHLLDGVVLEEYDDDGVPTGNLTDAHSVSAPVNVVPSSVGALVTAMVSTAVTAITYQANRPFPAPSARVQMRVTSGQGARH
jgi:hypothetical protein